MTHLIQLLVFLGGLGAAVAIGVMCGVCLLVWLSGGRRTEDPSEAWREADEL